METLELDILKRPVFSDMQIYMFSIFGVISFLSGLLVLWAYAKIKSMRYDPGMMILLICMSLTCLAFYDSYSGFYFIFTG